MTSKDFFTARWVRVLLIVLPSLIVLLLVFRAGMYVGYQKARFSYLSAQNAADNRAPPGAPNFFSDSGYSNSHGTIGLVKAINGTALTIQDTADGNAEKTIVVATSTLIHSSQSSASSSLTIQDIHLGDTLMVIGNPNAQGQIEAKFIRVVPK